MTRGTEAGKRYLFGGDHLQATYTHLGIVIRVWLLLTRYSQIVEDNWA